MFPISLTPDLTQTLVYAGLVLGGYVLRHVNVLRHASPTPTTSHRILDRILPILDEQLNQVLSDAAQRIVQPPAPAQQAQPQNPAAKS
jgi:hypothetical protein